VEDLARNIHSMDLGAFNQIFDQRIVPLNREHPEIPRRGKLRPVIVSSPILRIVEARCLESLKDTVLKKILSCQTGFVPICTIFVNLTSVISKVKKFSSRKRPCFLLYVDLSSANNTVDRKILLSKIIA